MAGGIDIKLTDGEGKGLKAHVHKMGEGLKDLPRHSALLTLSERALQFIPEFHPFLNDTFGNQMNQVVTFGGAQLRATIVHAGVNSGNAQSGTTDVASPAAFELDDTGQSFEAVVGPGSLVHNTATGLFARVVTVNSDTKLTLDTDIMQPGNEAYHINDIWPGTAVQGTWNFADGGEISITTADNNDEATFTVDASHIWDADDFVSFTGKIDLDVYNSTNNTIILEFGLDGAIVGNSINLNDFIDTGDFTAQTFVIPKVAFGLAAQNFNSMRIIVTRTGGAKPTIKFDNLQWENTGAPIVFKSTTPKGTRFHASEIVLRLEDVFDSTLANATMPDIPIDALLGVSSLANGILISIVDKGIIRFVATLKNHGDFMGVGAELEGVSGDATNTGLTYRIVFPTPFILEEGSDGSFISITINDTLSGLTRFTAVARGALEVSQ